MTGKKLKIKAIKTALDSFKTRILKFPNVLGVSTGIKRIGGKEVNQECVTIFVRSKIPLRNLSRRERIPKYFNARLSDGTADRSVRILTDVVQVGTVQAAAINGGEGIITQEQGTMTLAFTYGDSDKKNWLLSNRHVLAPRINNVGSSKVKARIDGTLVELGSLIAFCRTKEEGSNFPFFDAALAELTSKAISLVNLKTIKEPSQISTIVSKRALRARENGFFHICGSKSQLRTGKIWDVIPMSSTWKIEYQHLGTIEVDRLCAISTVVKKGDSGAPVYERLTDGNLCLVGILVGFAEDLQSGQGLALFHSIIDVENALKTVINDPFFELPLETIKR